MAVGCTGSRQLTERLETSDAELREQLDELSRAQEASYDRERAMAERLRRTEEEVAILQARIEAGEEQAVLPGSPSGSVPPSVVAAPFDASVAYQAALGAHQERRYDAAVAGFRQVLERAPDSSLADNAQYWIGEAYYALGRYRQALAEFTKVLAFDKTEKDDDAQLMIARSYLALGDREPAVAAFRKLLLEHMDSEYVDDARQELRYLEGQ